MLKSELLRMKFCSALVLAAAMALGVGGFSQSARAEGPRHAAMVIDANSGKVLHDANADEPRHPASLTKLMTIYLAFEALQQGSLQLNTVLTVSEAAASVAPSKLELKPGDSIELADAIKALVTKSANDMAVAIAEKISGDERSFAGLMTKRARQIGMHSTTFRNASGLPDSEQITTARDMLTLALRIYDDFPDKARVFSLREFTYEGKTFRTHNTLMKSFPGMDGMKTGYTSKSGFNLVASVRRDGKNLVAAVFGGATASSRNAHMRQILTKALDDASTEKTRIAKPQLIASLRAAARPQKIDPQQQRVEPKPKAKVAALTTPPKSVAKPAAKPVEAAKPAVVKAAPAPVADVSAVPLPAVAPAAPAPAQQQISVTPPDVPAPSPTDPAQSVSVSPPMIVASVKTIPIMPVMPSAPVATKEDRVIRAPENDVAQQSVSVSPPAPIAAGAASKLDFAGLRKAIAGPLPASDGPASDGPASDRALAERPVTAAPAATAPARQDETVIAKEAGSIGRAPSTLGSQAALLAPTGALPSAPAGEPAQTGAIAVPVAFSAPARPPSTLNAQASAATQALPVATPPMGLNGPAAATPAIQIGAYVSEQEAERQLEAVRVRAQAALTGTRPITRRVESGGRQLFAARFAGLDQPSATKACQELKQQSIDCFVVPSK